jgi:hypothetical protein
MIEVDHLAVWGEAKEPRNRRTILGTTVIVLKKADGTTPYPMGELYD